MKKAIGTPSGLDQEQDVLDQEGEGEGEDQVEVQVQVQMK
jgi:hypothetical protein